MYLQSGSTVTSHFNKNQYTVSKISQVNTIFQQAPAFFVT